MSYLPFRDNPDLATVSDETRVQIEALAERIEASHLAGLHDDLCACVDRKCKTWQDITSFPRPSVDEALGWLVGTGLLSAGVVALAVDADRMRSSLWSIEYAAARADRKGYDVDTEAVLANAREGLGHDAPEATDDANGGQA